MNVSGCASIRRALGEPLHGTAPAQGGAWLLIEHPGPWPASGPPPGLPRPAARIWDAAGLGIRPQLIRRVSGRRAVPPHQVFLAWSRGTDVWVEGVELADLSELASLDLAGTVAVGRRPYFGTEIDDPLLLVCTHGRRDACCARWGRAVAVDLQQRHRDLVWETSHVGGDRFAANIVCLPYGTYHGGADTDSAATVGAEAVAGRVSLPHYRGRCGMPDAAQSAEWFLRRETGLTSVDDVRYLRCEPGPGGLRTAEFDVTGRGVVRVAVRRVSSRAARITSCAEGGTSGTPVYHALVAVDVAVPA